MIHKIVLFFLVSASAFGLLVAPSSVELDVLDGETYQVTFFSPSSIDSIQHSCPIDAKIKSKTLTFSLNEYAKNQTIDCSVLVYSSQNEQVKASIQLTLHVRKDEIYNYSYSFTHYTTFLDEKKGELSYTNTGNVVVYPSFVSGDISESFIVLPGENIHFWINLSDSYLIVCELDCEVLLPQEYVELERPEVQLHIQQLGEGVKITIDGVSFPLNILLVSDKKSMSQVISEDGMYYYDELYSSVSAVYNTTLLAFAQVEVIEKKPLFSLQFIFITIIISIIFITLFVLQRKKS